MRKIFLTLISLFLIANASGAEKPLMILRFNDAGLSFERELQKVVSKVSSLNSEAHYKLISFVNQENVSDPEKYAINNAKKVANSLIKLGVSKDHIKASYQKNNDVETNEVHIFVE